MNSNNRFTVSFIRDSLPNQGKRSNLVYEIISSDRDQAVFLATRFLSHDVIDIDYWELRSVEGYTV